MTNPLFKNRTTFLDTVVSEGRLRRVKAGFSSTANLPEILVNIGASADFNTLFARSKRELETDLNERRRISFSMSL